MSKSLCVFLILLAAGPLYARAGDTSNEPIRPIPVPALEKDARKSELGRDLFSDVRLSRNGKVSCASCHVLSRGGADGLATSVGIDGAIGDINAPTVFNSALNFRQFWNGRARNLKEQIDGPVQHAKEMGANWKDVLLVLNGDPDLRQRFQQIYGEPASRESVKDAIAVFERSLVTPNARFDLFLNGKSSVLSELEKKGYQRFKSLGCVSCHQGVNVGGNMFQTMGVMGNYFADRGTPVTQADLGRFTVTKIESDRYVFRVPSLRNVELTAPYFHDGSAKTLEDAVRVMAKYQLGRELSREEIASIVAFLKTLTGEKPPLVAVRGGKK